MLGIINKLYIFLLLYAGWTLFETYNDTVGKEEELKNDLITIEKSITKARKDQKKVRNYLKNIDSKKQELEQVAQEIERIQKQLPTKISDAENQAFMRKVAGELKIKNVAITNLDEEDNGFYFTRKYELKGKATYLQFVLFLERLSESERILNVKNIKIEREKKNAKGRYVILKIKAIIESYRYNESHKEDRGLNKVEEDFKSTLQSRKPKRKKKSRKRKRRKR